MDYKDYYKNYIIIFFLILIAYNYNHAPRQIVQEDCYTVPNGIPELSQYDKEFIIQRAENAIVGGIIKEYEDDYGSIPNEVSVILRVNGERKSQGFAKTNNLEESVVLASLKAYEDIINKENKEKINPKDISIEVSILGKDKPYYMGYERGITGIRAVFGNKSLVILPKDIIELNIVENTAIKRLCRNLGLEDDCYKRGSVSFYLFDTQDFGTTYLSDKVLTFYRGNPVSCERINADGFEDARNLAEEWLFTNINEEGYFHYFYYPSSERYITDKNNMVRQFMASRILAERAQNNESLRELHKKNLDFIFSNWYFEEGDVGYVYFQNKSKLGASAALLRTLVYSPFFEDYEEEADKLYNSIVYLQNSDGSFNAWYIEPDYEYDEDYLLTFYSGEALLALTEYYEKTGREDILNTAIKSQDFYVKYYVDDLEKNYYPAYVPWHTMSLYHLYEITGNRKYAEAAFIMSDKALEIQNVKGEPYTDYKGRFFDPKHPEYGSPHVSSDGVYTEGVWHAYGLAREIGDERREEFYYERGMLALENLLRLQFSEEKMYYIRYPERVRGAMRSNIANNHIGVDNTQHAIAAFDAFFKFNKL